MLVGNYKSEPTFFFLISRRSRGRAGAAAFFCVIALAGMLLGAVKDRKWINVCQIHTCTCIYSKKQCFRELGNKLNLSTTLNSKLNRTTGLTLLAHSKQLFRKGITVWWPNSSPFETCFDVFWCHCPILCQVEDWEEFCLCYCPTSWRSVKFFHLIVELHLEGTEWVLV